MSEILHLVHLEDNPADALLIQEILDEGGVHADFVTVDTEAAFRDAIAGGGVDLILADFDLPGFDGFTALKIATALCPGTPFVFVSGAIGEDRAVQSLQNGATDYVLKQNTARLVPGIQRALKDARERALLRNAEQELRRLATVIEQAHESIVISDLDGVIEYVNPAFVRNTGFSPEEALGRNVSLVKSGKHDKAFYEVLWNTILAGEVWQGRFTNKKKDGALAIEDTTITPIRNAQGEIEKFAAVKRDVTEIVNLERQLRQAQKMEAIGTLAGGIAHDFNNILGGIIGYTELALQQLSEHSPLRKDLQHVMDGGQRAADLVRQILTFSRQDEQERKPTRIDIVTKEAVRLLSASIPPTVKITLDLHADCGLVLADASQIHQILMNLCTNAYYAMQESGGQVSVSLEPFPVDNTFAAVRHELAAGDYLMLTVSDTGPGIPPKVLDRIFEPFFTTKPQGEGTGLGLATVHGIVKAHGGATTVYSEVGHGTVFRIYLPAIPAGEGALLEARKPIIGGKERILVVDDETVIADIIKRMLERIGYTVTSVGSAAEALNVFQMRPDFFDLVLTDLMMPGMTGPALVKAIRETYRDIPFIIMSGYPDGQGRDLATVEGVRATLSKPTDAYTLAETIRRVLDQAKPS